ncbi:MAG: hypothetical protein IKU19_05595, partial [Clostridia bacterium]|nr:hypothetical protein [Clostridia bacterium]
MNYTIEKSRDAYKSAKERLCEVFGDAVIGQFDAEYTSAWRENSPVVGVCGYSLNAPVCAAIMNDPEV